MEHRKFLFVGGSREGWNAVPVCQKALTLVDGRFVQPAVDGSIDAPLNATVETYVLDEVGCQGGTDEPLSAYFLVGLEAKESRARLEHLLA